MDVSIIVPVLNESAQIQPFLRHLRVRAPDAEVIVVDGGSCDDTAELAAGLCDHVITTKSGRPLQMNAGAEVARGDTFWFLHADNEVPKSCISAIANALANPAIAGGCFRVRIPRSEWIFRVHDGLAHYVGRLLRVRCGDHGIFIRRSIFESIKGYPDVPLMEDVKLFRAMWRQGRVAWLSDRLLLSCRRHVQVGEYRYTLVCAIIVALFVLRVSPWPLAKVYHRLVVPRHRRSLNAVEHEIFTDFRSAHDGLVDETTVAERPPVSDRRIDCGRRGGRMTKALTSH